MSLGKHEAFRKVNGVLVGVIKLALNYLMHHDECFRQYSLKSAAWQGIDELKEIAPSMSEPFLTPVNACLHACIEARKSMPTVHVGCEEFPVAADSLARLAVEVEKILQLDPSLKLGIDDREIVSSNSYRNMAMLAKK